MGTCGGEEAGTTGFQLLRMSQDGPEHLLTPPAGLPAKPLGSGVSPPRSGLCLQAEAQGAPGRWQSLLSSPLPDLPTCRPHPHPTPHTPHSEPGTRAASLATGALAPSVLRCDPPRDSLQSAPDGPVGGADPQHPRPSSKGCRTPSVVVWS